MIKSKLGRFYVGDPCYVLSDEDYHDIWGDANNFNDGQIQLDDEKAFIVHGTAFGDGSYEDQFGNLYGVDSGTLSVIPLEACTKTDGLKFGKTFPGKEADLDYYEDGVFTIQVGDKNIIIQTGDEILEDEEEYDESEEEYDEYLDENKDLFTDTFVDSIKKGGYKPLKYCKEAGDYSLEEKMSAKEIMDIYNNLKDIYSKLYSKNMDDKAEDEELYSDIEYWEDRLKKLHEDKNNLDESVKIEEADKVDDAVQTILDEIKKTDWSAQVLNYSNGDAILISQYSPAGEDFSFEIKVKDNVSDMVDEISEYVNNFDINEHIQLWVDGAGQDGVPDVDELVEDARDIKYMLEDLEQTMLLLKKDNLDEGIKDDNHQDTIILKEFVKLKQAVLREKQFNKKVDLNQQLNSFIAKNNISVKDNKQSWYGIEDEEVVYDVYSQDKLIGIIGVGENKVEILQEGADVLTESLEDNIYYYELHFNFSDITGKDSDGYSIFFKSNELVDDDAEEIWNLAVRENKIDDYDDFEDVDYAQQIDKEEYESAMGTELTKESKLLEMIDDNMDLTEQLLILVDRKGSPEMIDSLLQKISNSTEPYITADWVYDEVRIKNEPYNEEEAEEFETEDVFLTSDISNKDIYYLLDPTDIYHKAITMQDRTFDLMFRIINYYDCIIQIYDIVEE